MLTQQKRINSLDFLRGIASLGVCWFHLTTFDYPTPDGHFYHLIKSSGEYGWLGVEIFFVISGFVIPYSLNRASYKLKAYPAFVLKRVVRLDPPYLVTIAVLLLMAYAKAFYSGRVPVIEGASIDVTRVVLHLGYLTAFFDYLWLNPGFWTLAIEFQYYLLMGLAFPFLNSPRRLIRLAALICFAAPVFFAPLVGEEMGVPYSKFIFSFTPLFVMGIVTFQRHAGLLGRKEYTALLLAAGVMAFVILGVAPALAGLLAVIVINFYSRENFIAAFFGNISYSLYLLHWPLGHETLSIVGNKFVGATSDVARIFMLLVAFGVCIAAAFLLYLIVEKPAQRWSARIRYGSKRGAATNEEVSGLAPNIPVRVEQ